jgi:hypothetical protein
MARARSRAPAPRVRAASVPPVSDGPPHLILLLSAFLIPGCGDGVTELADRNHPPRFLNLPSYAVQHDREYVYAYDVHDEDGDTIVVTAPVLPRWLRLDPVARRLSGTAGPDAIGNHAVRLRAMDGQSTTDLDFTVTVNPDLAGLRYDGSWIPAGFYFGHDGTPVRSAHFNAYSGFSSPFERQYVADQLEDILAQLQTTLGIEGQDDFESPAGQMRIDVLTLRHQGNDAFWTGQSYRYGLIVHARDSPRYAAEGYTASLYRQLLGHELMHVVEYLLIGTDGHYSDTEKWFHEGIATYLAGPPPNRVTGAAQVQDWRNRMRDLAGQGNPLRVKTGSDYPPEVASDAGRVGEYYLYFELAVRYLLDPAGLGRKPADVRQMYLDIRNGVTFQDAFRDRMGLSVSDYESGFWEIMLAWLD